MDYLRHSTSQERESIGRGAKGLQGHKKMTACTCHHLPITFFALLMRFLSSDETRIYYSNKCALNLDGVGTMKITPWKSQIPSGMHI